MTTVKVTPKQHDRRILSFVRGGRCVIDPHVEFGQGCVIACQEQVEIGEGSSAG